MYTEYLESPLGIIEIKATNNAVTQIIFCGKAEDASPNNITTNCKQELLEYFSGERKHFSVPLDPVGTDFQNKVWNSLSEIPFGEMRSYSDIANSINNPKAVRAVGGANGRNPISIIIPCHRVIGKHGALTGYAGGEERKYWLLKHEGIKIKMPTLDDLLDLEKVKHLRQEKTRFLK